jgi:hypothetical protein
MTIDLNAVEVDVLRGYPSAVYHLRAQLHRRKLMPVFGAGASEPIGLPVWNMLVGRIAEHLRVKAVATAAGATSQASSVLPECALGGECALGERSSAFLGQ